MRALRFAPLPALATSPMPKRRYRRAVVWYRVRRIMSEGYQGRKGLVQLMRRISVRYPHCPGGPRGELSKRQVKQFRLTSGEMCCRRLLGKEGLSRSGDRTTPWHAHHPAAWGGGEKKGGSRPGGVRLGGCTLHDDAETGGVWMETMSVDAIVPQDS